MNIKWLSNHWFILAFVFSSGGAYAWQEIQRQTIEDVIVKQAQIVEEQHKVNEAVIRLEERSETMRDAQEDITDKLEFIIRLQLKGDD